MSIEFDRLLFYLLCTLCRQHSKDNQKSNGNMQRVHRCFSLIDFINNECTELSMNAYCYSTIVQKCLYASQWMVSTPSWFNLLEMRAQNVFILFRVHLLTRHHFQFFLLLLLIVITILVSHLLCVHLCLCRFRFIRCILVWRSHSFRCHIIPCRSTSSTIHTLV